MKTTLNYLIGTGTQRLSVHLFYGEGETPFVVNIFVVNVPRSGSEYSVYTSHLLLVTLTSLHSDSDLRVGERFIISGEIKCSDFHCRRG